MPATTGYQAGAETDLAVLSYLAESVWGTTPAAQFQRLRLTGVSLSGAKNRTRPAELVPHEEVAQAITGQESAGGQINFGLSYGTYDDFLAGALGADWQAAQAINGSSGDITLTNISSTTATLSSTTANKFANLSGGQWIRTLGWTAAANNQFMRVIAKASNQSVTVTTTAPVVTETPTGSNAKVRASTIVNAALVKTFSIQKQFGASTYFRYPGSLVRGFTLNSQVGGFVSGSFDILAAQEYQSASDWSTGAVLAAPTGSVHDAVPGWGGTYIDETGLSAGVSALSLTVTRPRAAMQYAMGSATAAGLVLGALEVSGTLTMFFRSFTEYARFKNETLGRFAFITKDSAGNGYVFSLLNAAFMNPQIVAGGQSDVIQATFTIEGNPQAASGTIQIDRLPAV